MADTPSVLRRVVARRMNEVKPVLLALALVLIARTVAAEPYTVPTPSMVPTLLVGDTLIASKFAYGYGKYSSPIGLMPDFAGRLFGKTPERGDVVVFRLPRDPAITYVKRVIGLPGDRIRMRGGRLYINGTLVPRRPVGWYANDVGGLMVPSARYIEALPNGRAHEIVQISDAERLADTPEYRVPPRHYFMMGDNRDDSLDSRVAAEEGGVGFVPEENLIGRVDMVLLSRNPGVAWWDVPDWLHAFRPGRAFSPVS